MEGLDYSYFGATPQPYQFIGLPPTPGFSQPGDEFTAPKVSSAVSCLPLFPSSFKILCHQILISEEIIYFTIRPHLSTY